MAEQQKRYEGWKLVQRVKGPEDFPFVIHAEMIPIDLREPDPEDLEAVLFPQGKPRMINFYVEEEK